MTRHRVSHRGLLAVSLVAAVALAGCSSSGSTSPRSATQSGPASATAVQQTFVDVVNKVRPSVVEITTASGLGSGVVYDANGDIVTNAHVVGTAQTFQVTFFDGQTVTASLVGTYPSDDLAVIKVSRAKGVNVAGFADSSKLQIGDIALAIGNPVCGLAVSLVGWRWMFVVTAIPSLIWCGVWWWAVEDDPREARWLDPAVKARLVTDSLKMVAIE